MLSRPERTALIPTGQVSGPEDSGSSTGRLARRKQKTASSRLMRLVVSRFNNLELPTGTATYGVERRPDGRCVCGRDRQIQGRPRNASRWPGAVRTGIAVPSRRSEPPECCELSPGAAGSGNDRKSWGCCFIGVSPQPLSTSDVGLGPRRVTRNSDRRMGVRRPGTRLDHRHHRSL